MEVTRQTVCDNVSVAGKPLTVETVVVFQLVVTEPSGEFEFLGVGVVEVGFVQPTFGVGVVRLATDAALGVESGVFP